MRWGQTSRGVGRKKSWVERMSRGRLVKFTVRLVKFAVRLVKFVVISCMRGAGTHLQRGEGESCNHSAEGGRRVMQSFCR